jgi:signal transduction histidine kinase
VFFVVSEGLTNAARHSRATEVTVTVRRTRARLRLDVVDNGHGEVTPAGGLQGLADRVTSLGGRLAVETAAGGGTRLWAELPCG